MSEHPRPCAVHDPQEEPPAAVSGAAELRRLAREARAQQREIFARHLGLPADAFEEES